MSEYRSGFVALVGKPNVGKSTLVNRLVGQKVAITSSKPQTTRHRVMGVVHGDNYQVVLVDTPGLSEPKHALARKMVKYALEEAREADRVLMLAELTHAPTDEDRAVVEKLQRPAFLVMTKMDLEKKPGLREQYQALADFEQSFVLSALTGEGVDTLLEALVAELQPGHPFFPADQVSDQNRRILAAEVLREKVLRNTRQEIPHSVAVVVEELRPGETAGVTYINAYFFVERDGQKRILIGQGGKLLKKIGSQAREELEELWGEKVYLELWVKVKADWREREDWLRTLGYE